MSKMNTCWKPCMHSKAWNHRGIGLLVLSAVILTFTIVVSVLIAMEEDDLVLAVAGILAFGVGQFLYFFFLFVIERRKFRINEDGITIRYMGGIQKIYPWAVFPKIVVCDFDHASKFPSNCFLVIRLASLEEIHGPHSKKQKYTLSGIESWRGYHYTVRNFNKILFLEYSPALLEEIVHLSKLETMFSLTRYGKEKMDAFSVDAGRDA